MGTVSPSLDATGSFPFSVFRFQLSAFRFQRFSLPLLNASTAQIFNFSFAFTRCPLSHRCPRGLTGHVAHPSSLHSAFSQRPIPLQLSAVRVSVLSPQLLNCGLSVFSF